MVSLCTVISVFILLSISSTGATYGGNYALSFDGVSNIVKIGHMYTDLSLADFWTLEAWIKPYGGQGSMFQPNIVGFPQRHPNLELCGQSTNPGCPGNPTKTLTQLRELNGNYYTKVGGNGLPDTTNNWYHLAATWNNLTLSTYINGVQDGDPSNPYQGGYQKPKNCSFPVCDEGLDIGGYRFILPENGQLYSNQYFSGIIDEVRVWTIGRSQTDIQATMGTVLTGNEAGLLYYFRFDEGMGPLVNSHAFTAYGTLGGGITASEPRWVESDSPLANPYPAPTTPTQNLPPCNCNEAGVYVAGSILGILFIIAGTIIGVCGFKKLGGNYAQLK